MNTIKWARKASKQLMKLNKADQGRIYDAASKLSAMPNVQNVKSLAANKYGYRLRVGNYRVLFDWDGAIKIVNIEEVRRRDERTY